MHCAEGSTPFSFIFMEDILGHKLSGNGLVGASFHDVSLPSLPFHLALIIIKRYIVVILAPSSIFTTFLYSLQMSSSCISLLEHMQNPLAEGAHLIPKALKKSKSSAGPVVPADSSVAVPCNTLADTQTTGNVNLSDIHRHLLS